MKKLVILIFLLSTFLLLPPFTTKAQGDVEISVNETEHTVLMPYEKSFRFITTIKNSSSNTINMQIDDNAEEPPGWHILTPDRRFRLDAGEEIDWVVVFEPELSPGTTEEETSVSYEFRWENGEEIIDVRVIAKQLMMEEAENDAEIKFNVYDSETNNPISSYTVKALLASGIEQFREDCTDSKDCVLNMQSIDSINELIQDYTVDHTCEGYYLQVSAKGYKSYFEDNFIPSEGTSEREIYLTSLNQYASYELIKTIESGYSIWWIKASNDSSYIAISQGAHDSPDEPPPDQTKVMLTDADGNLIWERETGGECWGLDISSNGNFVAAGCHDGKIYMWDKDGNEIWTHENGEGQRVRWVKFSPDEDYLITGPVNSTPEETGYFNTQSGELIWSFNTGGYLREGRFSSDGSKVYLASANGTLYAVSTSDGSKLWLGKGQYYIPFILGLSETSNTIIATGKGRVFKALDLATGEEKWSYVIDQTITAGEVADNGSVIGSSVGGVSYGIDSSGELIWVRKYGGVGHNGVYYTKNGKYAIFGGPNPTLFDNEGNILWQREKDIAIEMSGPVDRNTGGNDTWMSEDGSIIIIGQGDGDIQFYKGQIQSGNNDYSQLIFMGDEPLEQIEDRQPDTSKDESPKTILDTLKSYSIILTVIAILLLILFVSIILYIKTKKGNSRNSVNKLSNS